MSIYLAATTDKLQITTSSAATLDVQINYIEAVSATGAVSSIGRQNTALSSATTTDVLSAPGSSNTRTLKQMTVRNKDASLSCDVTLIFNQNGTSFEIYKATLATGDVLEYIEGVGFFILYSPVLAPTANCNTSDVTANAADTILTGASLTVDKIIQAGTVFRVRGAMTKTAAGTATPIFNVRYGTAGTTSDTSRGTHTLVAQTAATDTGWFDLEVAVRAVGASGQLQSTLRFEHKNTTTGLANAAQVQILQATSATFDTTPSGSILSLSCNPGASGVWTFQNVSVAAFNTKIR